MAAAAEHETSAESELFAIVIKRELTEVKRLLREKNVNVNCIDEHGMTPLQHSAYKGDTQICKVLLDHGADVNASQHEHGYTTLMFAALSGNVFVTSLVLDAGANVSAVNSVGRTASHMASFVGNHACVSVINTFIPRQKIDYFTEPRGLETEPKLPSQLSGLVHRFVSRLNIHPVGIALFAKQNQPLAEESDKITRVLQLMSEKEMKSKETNEILAFKLHFLSYVLKYCIDVRNKGIDSIIKSWLRTNESLELFIRQGIRQFSYPDSGILHQLVRSLAPVKVGDEPSAFSLVNASVNGQRMVVEESCATCGLSDCDLKKCSACKNALYCGPICQKLHWFIHKKNCFHRVNDAGDNGAVNENKQD